MSRQFFEGSSFSSSRDCTHDVERVHFAPVSHDQNNEYCAMKNKREYYVETNRIRVILIQRALKRIFHHTTFYARAGHSNVNVHRVMNREANGQK